MTIDILLFIAGYALFEVLYRYWYNRMVQVDFIKFLNDKKQDINSYIAMTNSTSTILGILMCVVFYNPIWPNITLLCLFIFVCICFSVSPFLNNKKPQKDDDNI